MNTLRLLVLVATLGPFSVARSSEDGLVRVPLPLDTIQEGIAVVEVPFIIGKALPESAFQAIGVPYVPPSISFHEPEDINAVSVAGIVIKPFHESGRKYRIELDYGKVAPPHRTEELLGAVVECLYRVARQDDGYALEVTITNLAAESPLHEALRRLVKEKAGATEADSAPDTSGEDP